MAYFVEKRRPTGPYAMTYHRMSDNGVKRQHLGEALEGVSEKHFETISCQIDPSSKGDVLSFVGDDVRNLLDQIEAQAAFQLEKHEVGQGIIGGPDAAFLYPHNQTLTEAERAFMKPHYTTAERFAPGRCVQQIAYITRDNLFELNADLHPHFVKHMSRFQDKLANRRESKSGAIQWFHLHWPRKESLFCEGPKLVCPTRVSRPAFAYVEAPYYASRAVNMVVSRRIDLRYLAGVLNSSVVHFWLRHRGKRLGKMLQIDTAFLLSIPIPRSKDLEPKIIETVINLQTAIQSEKAARSDSDKSHAENVVDVYNQRLDALVLELYQLPANAQLSVLGGHLVEPPVRPDRE